MVPRRCGLAPLLALALWAAAARECLAWELVSGSTLMHYQIGDMEALCNDGSPSGFYFKPYNQSFPEQQNLWLIYLECVWQH